MAFRRRSSDDEEDSESTFGGVLAEGSKRLVFQAQKGKEDPLPKSTQKDQADFLPDIRVTRSRSRSPVRQIRRGEQGKSLDDIKKMEKAGFVMSGSRRRQQAEVAPPSEKELATKRIEEKSKKEELLMDHFRKLILEKQKSGSN